MEKIHHFNIVSMMNGNGATSFSSIYEELEKMTINKLGYLPTFEDLYIRFNKLFICVTYNVTEDRTEYLSHENSPHMPCLTALKMSCNLPLIFDKYKYGNSFYIDGGISDNFAIDIGDQKGKKVLGIMITSDTKSFNEYESSIVEYIYKLIFIPISQSTEFKIKNISEKCKIVKLDYPNLKFFNFKISLKDKLDIFSSGYEQMKKEFETKEKET